MSSPQTHSPNSDVHGYDAVQDRPSPARYLREVLDYPRLAWRHDSLLRNFFRREFLGRFRGSLLGGVWVLIHPFFLFATYYLVFGILFNMRDMPPSPMSYPLYLFIGILAWTAFIETTTRAVGLVVDNGNLIQKVAFPAQLLPLHLIAVNLIVYTVGVIVYMILALCTGWALPGMSLLALPAVLVVQAIFTLGLSLLLAGGFVFMRDLAQIYPILATLWFFATPVFWHPTLLTPESQALVASVAWCNPMEHILAGHRAALGVGFPLQTTGDAFMHSLHALPFALVMFVIGFLVFRSLQHRFADEV
ncbi:MAG: ABC transporter permease [Planctomycetota bacterium]|jgi:lipopolysaccharide transport system permease protein|nr:ABC transporter permease [Planctomycetota bacterium]